MFKHKINSIFALLGVLILLFFSSCSDFVDDFQDDPNNAANAPIEAVLNAAFTGTIIAHEGQDARLACLWSGQFTGSDRQYSGFQVYNTNAENFDWDVYYLVAENSKIVIEKSKVTNNTLASGISRILTAHSLGATTALWGDVPYTQANNFGEFPTPVLDDQVDIYNDLQQNLSNAIAELSTNPSSPVIEATDFYFKGDPTKWSAIANTLKARFYLHAQNYSAALEAASKGALALDGDWMAPHTTGSYNQDMNIYHSFGVLDREGYMTANSAYLPTLLDANHAAYRGNAKTDESARFAHIFTGEIGTYDLNYSGMWAANASYPLVSSIETNLILAESEWRGNNDMAAALGHLNAARDLIAAQYPDGTYEPYEIADFDETGIAGRTGSTAAEALLHEIMEEKYVSLVGQTEVFNDLRRTDNFLGIPVTTGTSIPERFLYPQAEIDTNTNIPSPIPNLFVPTPVNK